MECLQCLCFCFDFGPSTPVRPVSTRKKKTVKPSREYRLNTKYKKQEFVLVPDQIRKAGNTKCYCCPICTNYYTKILACSNCNNYICLSCFDTYDQRNVKSKTKMKCSFCNSTDSVFNDYELQPHSYFDTTNKGFLSKEERLKIDAQLAQKQPQKECIPLQNIIQVREQ